MYATILLRSILTYCMQIDALKKAMEWLIEKANSSLLWLRIQN